MRYRNLGRTGIKVSPYGLGTLDQAYVPPAIQKTELRRRPLSERSAT
jgi:aryl-alcohol dehydrogenase-like predicted oxidoreductase